MRSKKLFRYLEQHAEQHGGEETLRIALSYVALATRTLTGPFDAFNEYNQVHIRTEFAENLKKPEEQKNDA